MRKYLLAADGSENSKRAARFLLDLVRGSSGFAITVINVLNVRKEIYNFSAFADIGEIERIVHEQAQGVVDEIAKILQNEGIKVEKVVLEGDPGYEIAEHARLGDYNQIVMGTRGLSNIKGLVMGSVSHKVIHFSKTPVTLVK